MIIKQIAIGFMDNFSYLVGCENTRQALVIDPGPDVEQIVSLAADENLEVGAGTYRECSVLSD